MRNRLREAQDGHSMGKKNRRRGKRSSLSDLGPEPFVSLCTPTFNRRPFIRQLARCVLAQSYPAARMEWLVLDDGTDPIEDLLPADSPIAIRYFRHDEKRSLGAKRNYLHAKAKGQIIVNIDDDDYYPPERVSHAVETLRANPKILCAGSSALNTYFADIDKFIRFGPYGPHHCTAATMAFRKELLTRTRYDPAAALAEEKAFLQDYTIPLAQLDPRKSIVVVAHGHNTFDKKRLLGGQWGSKDYAHPAGFPIEEAIHDAESLAFYTQTVHGLLTDYPAGSADQKPDVKAQFSRMEESRLARMDRRRAESEQPSGISVQEPEGGRRELTAQDVVEMLKSQRAEIASLKEQLRVATRTPEAPLERD